MINHYLEIEFSGTKVICITYTQGNIHVLRNQNKGGGGGVRKWQFLVTFSTESNHKGEGVLKPQIFITYYMYGPQGFRKEFR